jgi:RimJ/RimL family protein N-acetyltransferase
MVIMIQNDKRISFKPVTPDDIPLLFAWFLQPHVHQWWAVPETLAEFSEYILEKVKTDKAYAFMVLLNDVPLGYIQYYNVKNRPKTAESWLPTLPKNTVGIDQIIGEKNMLGKGYGTLFIKEFITYLSTTAQPSVTTVIADPDAANIGAVKCYEKIGFKNMGTYDAGWGQAALMRYDI